MKLPTSDLKTFQYQLNNPNTVVKGELEIKNTIKKIQKNIVLAYPSDNTGCGHIRCIFPMNYLNADYGNGPLVPIVNSFFNFSHEILSRTRSIFFQRVMHESQLVEILKYKDLQKRYGFKMVYDIDDFIWDGLREGECIPDYNVASSNIKPSTKKTATEIMKLMDTVCVSTEFLKDYLVNTLGLKNNVVVVHNSIPKYFWFNQGKRPKIIKNIEKPKVVYTGSPSHYCNLRKKKGDWENAWLEWVLKNVRENKIEFMCMGGLPWFFESIKNKIHLIGWKNSYEYHNPIIKFRPHFGIAPLVPNYFNYSKSAIKYQEYCAVGAIGIGTTFSNGMPSPYDVCKLSVKNDCSFEDINNIVETYKDPILFNSMIEEQYKQMDDMGWWQESKKFVETLSSVL